MQGMEKMPMRRQEINQVIKEHKPRLGAQSQKVVQVPHNKKKDAQMHKYTQPSLIVTFHPHLRHLSIHTSTGWEKGIFVDY